MTSGSTREFLALWSILQHLGRPHPTDQASIERFLGHVKGEWPTWSRPQPDALRAALEMVRGHDHTVRRHPGIG
jgi:transposase InsO family protein